MNLLSGTLYIFHYFKKFCYSTLWLAIGVMYFLGSRFQTTGSMLSLWRPATTLRLYKANYNSLNIQPTKFSKDKTCLRHYFKKLLLLLVFKVVSEIFRIFTLCPLITPFLKMLLEYHDAYNLCENELKLQSYIPSFMEICLAFSRDEVKSDNQTNKNFRILC